MSRRRLYRLLGSRFLLFVGQLCFCFGGEGLIEETMQFIPALLWVQQTVARAARRDAG